MQTFKINKDGFRNLNRRFLAITIPVMGIIIALVIAYGPVSYGGITDDAATSVILIAIVLVSAGFGLYRGFKKVKAFSETYTLTIAENLITREQANTPPVSIYFHDIKEIVKHRNNTFTIIGKAPVDIIGIPAHIENYPQLETRLQEIQPVVLRGNMSVLQKYTRIATYLTIGLMICILIADNKLIVGLSGSVLVAWFIVRFMVAITGKNTGKGGAWRLLLIIASVIILVFFKLLA